MTEEKVWWEPSDAELEALIEDRLEDGPLNGVDGGNEDETPEDFWSMLPMLVVMAGTFLLLMFLFDGDPIWY